MMKYLLTFFAALFALSLPAAAQDLEGTWALQIDEAAIFVFSLEQAEDGSWRGSWLRPERFQGTGVIFSQIRGSERSVTTDAEMEGEVLIVRFPPTRVEGSIDVLHFRSTGEYVAEVKYTGTNLEPYPLVLVPRGTVLGPFSDGHIYDRDNAATQADYDPADEASVEAAPAEAPLENAEEATAEVEEEAADVPQAGTGEAPEEREPAGLSDDFLDGLSADTTAASVPAATQPAAAPSIARACSDLDRDDLPNAEELAALWGDEFESIGSGLEIREYQMENGDVARVTLLGERIYLNSCGPVT